MKTPRHLPKTVHVIVPSSAGGAESVVRNLAVGARQLPAAVEIAAVVHSEAPHPFIEGARSEGSVVHPVVTRPRQYVEQIRALAAVLERTAAQAVQTHVYLANFVGFRAARKCGLPVIATIHGFTAGGIKNRFYEWFDLRQLRWFDGVACVSDAIRARVVAAGVPPDKTAVVPNGVFPSDVLDRETARAELGLALDEPVVGWIGRLSYEKGPDLFVETIARLPKPRPVAVMLGSGPEMHRMRQLLVSRVLDDRIRLLGERPNAARWLRAIDVLALSSRAEGTPMVLLEAIAVGVPVVSFAVGGIPSVIDDSSGWLVPTRDTGALSDAIRHALTEPDEAKNRTAAARRVFEDRFTAEKSAVALYEFYERVIPTAGYSPRA